MTPAAPLAPAADAAPTPAAPGWYVRWDGGDRWRPDDTTTLRSSTHA